MAATLGRNVTSLLTNVGMETDMSPPSLLGDTG